MSYEILDIELESIDEELLELIVDYLIKSDKQDYPKDPVPPREAILKVIKLKREGKDSFLSVVLDKERGKIIARATISVKLDNHVAYNEAKHVADFDLTVLEDFVHLEIIEKLFTSVISKVESYDYVSTIRGCNMFEEEFHLWLKRGALLINDINVNRLYFDEVNWELMKRWREEGRKRAVEEDIKLVSFEECPEELIDKYAELYTQIGNLIPFEEEEEEELIETTVTRRTRERIRREKGEFWLTLITKEKDGRLSGLTEIVYDPIKSHLATQMLTGVSPEYRQRGLGKWLKAEMLFKMKEKLPKVIAIHTGNAKINAPMLSINERMGFRTVLKVKCFSMKL
ncbi:MAG: GNAT family N-acetyltransferase [Candidatus Heimdallarchaeaceae archaeon]